MPSGPNAGLLAIGEQALTRAEDFEDAGRAVQAREAYARAVWAFDYSRRLTGGEPLLLDAARDGWERTGAGAASVADP